MVYHEKLKLPIMLLNLSRVYAALLFTLITVLSIESYSCISVPHMKPYRILGIFPHHGRSHFDVFAPLLKALSARGHEVTVISHFPLQEKIPRYTDIVFDNNALTDHSPNREMIPFDQLTTSNRLLRRYLTVFLLATFARNTCDRITSPPVLNYLATHPTYDLVITELFATHCHLSLLANITSPLIGVTSGVPLPWTNDLTGTPDHPAYVPNVFMDFGDRLTFRERVENALAYVWNRVWFRVLIEEVWFGVSGDGDGDGIKEMRDLEYLARNVSVVLVNTHFSVSGARPWPSNVVEVGGIHITGGDGGGGGGVKDMLWNKNIEKWLNESSDTEGVIYFSMGSMIKGHTFPVEKRQAFLRAFARFPRHRVLWKWETETMPDKPENVMIQKWMPQFDILCHPKVKAFISHGGMLGTTEAVHCGVPILVMPQFGDQHTNARALEASGGGVILNFQDVTEDSVVQGLKTILDHKFNKQAKELSERFRDRPLPPLETAIYWIEYVARHRGAPHMRTAAVGMPFYQYLLLDVIAFLATIVFIFAYVTKKIIRAIFARICGRGKKTESTLIKKKQR